MLTCSHCQSSQLPNTLFCDLCGEALVISAAANPLIKHEALAPLVCELPERRQRLRLPTQPELVFGRSDTRSGVLPDVDLASLGGREGGVSRLHARLTRDGKSLFLEDMGSMNGTFINERPLPPHQRVPLRLGDRVRLGLLRLIFHPAD